MKADFVVGLRMSELGVGMDFAARSAFMTDAKSTVRSRSTELRSDTHVESAAANGDAIWEASSATLLILQLVVS